MDDYRLICHKCGKIYPVKNYGLCPECNGILTLEYSDKYLKEVLKEKENHKNMWEYASLLPPIKEENRVSFGEGGTPLVRSREIGPGLGLENLYFKNETCNPTGSFKDRAVSVCISMAKEFACEGVVVSSSGNGGAAVSAYGMKGEMNPIILIPEKTPMEKVAQAVAYGGRVVKVKGNFSQAYHAAMEISKKRNYMNVTTTFLSPYGIEGYKTIAYEIYEQLHQVPDYIFIPVGAGPALYGIYKAYEELKRGKKIEKIPKLVGVQASGCAPIVEAWEKKCKVNACRKPETIASAISDPLVGYEQDGDITVEAVRKTDGCAIAVEDTKILEAGKALARKEGIFVEPSSAVTTAALEIMRKKGILKREDVCVCILTGHGLKDSSAYVPQDIKIQVIEQGNELYNGSGK